MFETLEDPDKSRQAGTDGRGPGSETDELVPSLVAGAAPDRTDFEHRLLLTNVSKALFGRGEPLHIDKYRVERRIGEGGMGEVYLCEDTLLHRKVALKRVLGAGSEASQERLRREAQALARLSHPNVVQVYDSGEHEGRTYLAMEYVAGQTLRDWLNEPRSWREILAVFLEAGRGLAVAHEAGLVHRDFKPDNVLIGADQRVRVADFGVALADPLRVDDLSPSELASSDPRRSSTVGAVVGTRQYMPLEQILGARVDARSDQFSFCLSLYEALWREQPFEYASLAARIEALRVGTIAPPKRHRDLFRLIRRGLAPEPDARWPSMNALLSALERAPRRRRWAAAGGVITAGLAVGLALMLVFPPADVERESSAALACATIEQQLHDTWNDQIRAELDQRLLSLDAGHVSDSRVRVFEALDRWREAWITERADVCADMSAALDPARDREAQERDRCLTRQHRSVQTIVAELLEGDADTLANAVVALSELPNPTACADDLSLQGVDPPPQGLASMVEVLRGQLERAHQLRILGQRREALVLTQSLEATALELGYGPLLAEVLGERADYEQEAGSSSRAAELYDEAIKLAVAHHHDKLAAHLALERAELSVFQLGEIGGAELRIDNAERENQRAGSDPQVAAGIESCRGGLAALKGDAKAAEQHYVAAILLAGDDAPKLPAYLDNLADLVAKRDATTAVLYRARAVQIGRDRWGSEHPRVALLLYNYGETLRLTGQSGRDEQLAAALASESGSVRDRALVEYIKGTLAIAGLESDEAIVHADALAYLQNAFLPNPHEDRGAPHLLRALAAGIQTDYEAACVHARAALRFFELDPDPSRAIATRNTLANYLLSSDQLGEAAELLHDQIVALNDDPAQTAISHFRLAEIAVRRERLEAADEQLQLCVRARDQLGQEVLAYEVLRGLVDVRTGRWRPEQRQRLDDARSAYPQVDTQLPGWLDDLEVSESERQTLGF